MYYNIIRNKIEKNKIFLDWFVLGSPGYGTTQQIILLERYWEKIKPDYVICTGSLSKRYLRKNNTPSKKILIASALRQQIIKKNSKIKKNIIILLPLEFSSSVEMLSKIYEDRDKIFKNLNNKVIIKPHPLSNVVSILKKIIIFDNAI